ncbi:hypothetical protein ACOMHN_057611 [Nucella lapillus]
MLIDMPWGCCFLRGLLFLRQLTACSSGLRRWAMTGQSSGAYLDAKAGQGALMLKVRALEGEGQDTLTLKQVRAPWC